MAMDMYKIGKGRPRWKRRTVAFFVILILGAVGILVFFMTVSKDAENSLEVTNKPGGTRVYKPEGDEEKKVFDEPLYSFLLPGDWNVSKRNEDPRFTSVEYQMGKKPQNRWITIYVDRFPQELPVNRVIPVSVDGNKLNESSPSPNCANFTIDNSNSNVKITKAPTKHENVKFICELDNTYNNVLAAGSEETGTVLTMKGISQGEHKYIILYKDHSIPSDDSPFRQALQSFTAK